MKGLHRILRCQRRLPACPCDRPSRYSGGWGLQPPPSGGVALNCGACSAPVVARGGAVGPARKVGVRGALRHQHHRARPAPHHLDLLGAVRSRGREGDGRIARLQALRQVVRAGAEAARIRAHQCGNGHSSLHGAVGLNVARLVGAARESRGGVVAVTPATEHGSGRKQHEQRCGKQPAGAAAHCRPRSEPVPRAQRAFRWRR